jgi:dynein light chain 4, axonemal
MFRCCAQSSDMSSDLQSESMDLIVSALDKTRNNYELAARLIKEAMERKFGACWHCCVGEHFGAECTHQQGHSLHMYYQGQVAVLLFKCCINRLQYYWLSASKLISQSHLVEFNCLNFALSSLS